MTLDGFKLAVLEHLQLKAGEVTHATISLRFSAPMMTITVGAIAVDPMTNGGGSTTFSQDLINKLPL